MSRAGRGDAVLVHSGAAAAEPDILTVGSFFGPVEGRANSACDEAEGCAARMMMGARPDAFETTAHYVVIKPRLVSPMAELLAPSPRE